MTGDNSSSQIPRCACCGEAIPLRRCALGAVVGTFGTIGAAVTGPALIYWSATGKPRSEWVGLDGLLLVASAVLFFLMTVALWVLTRQSIRWTAAHLRARRGA